ncbi:1425_t:CDS:2, partial [Paraglomus occultum]
AGGSTPTGDAPNGAGDPGLGGGNGNDTCPTGTFHCEDSEGGCCPNGTTCLPNFKCSAPGTGAGGSTGNTPNGVGDGLGGAGGSTPTGDAPNGAGAGGGTGINNTTAGGDNTNTTTTTGGNSTDNTTTTGDDSTYNTSSGNDNTTPTGNGDATPTSSNNAKGDTGSNTSGVYNYKTQLRLSDLFLTIIPVILVHLYV